LERPSPGAQRVEHHSEAIDAAIERVVSGDKQAYAIIIREYEKKIYTYCYCILKSREGAEDAVQEIFLKAYQNLSRYEKQASLLTWLYKIAYFHCVDLIRKQSRWHRLLSLCKERLSLSAPTYVNYTEQAVNEMLMYLNWEERNILLLRVVEQYSFEEIGKIMGCKPATLRQRFARLRKKLINQRIQEGGAANGEVAERT